jgi:hypothetical protein
MTMNLTNQITNVQAPDHTFYPATSDMNPLPLDAFDLPYDMPKPMTPEYTPENISLPEKEVDSSVVTPMQNAPAAVARTLPVLLPDIVGDPILENARRQAQLGLFVTLGYDRM